MDFSALKLSVLEHYIFLFYKIKGIDKTVFLTFSYLHNDIKEHIMTRMTDVNPNKCFMPILPRLQHKIFITKVYNSAINSKSMFTHIFPISTGLLLARFKSYTNFLFSILLVESLGIF